MTAVGGPRRTFVFTFARETPRLLVADVDHPHLKVAILLLERDRPAIRRPVRRRAISSNSRYERSEQLHIRPVGVHGVHLGESRAGGDESNLTAVGAEGR